MSFVIHKSSIKVFFSAAEASGDRHAAGVIRELKSSLHEVDCIGLGGPLMEREGCKLLENIVDRSAMLLHVMGKLGSFLKLRKRVRAYLIQERPDVVVLVDSFAWNIHVARIARKSGIPVLYYVAPQLWAWAPWRIHKLRKTADRIAAILPFEPEWFKKRGLEVNYVGHPLFDNYLPSVAASEPTFPTVALLPGSRSHEIDMLWLPMQKIASQIKGVYPDVRFLSTTVNNDMANLLKERTDPQLGIEIRQTSIQDVTRQADLALVASGTATLEVAAENCPMIVMYHVHPLPWHLLGRWLLTTPYLCLVNILAQRELVPEFMPFYRDTDKVSQCALDLLSSDRKRDQMRQSLQQLMEPLIRPGAAKAVAQMINTVVRIRV